MQPRPNPISLWFRATRPYALPASTVPVLLGAALALAHGDASWGLLPLVLACSWLFHAGTNLVNDYYDFKKGVDQDYRYATSGSVVGGMLEPRQVLIGGWVMFGVGSALGMALVAVRGAWMLALGVVGFLGGYFYTAAPVAYKYFALGDALVFALMGPLMVIGSYFALTGGCTPTVIWASLPIGCLVTSILNANNLRDIAHDADAEVRTLANVFGHRVGQWEYVVLVAGAYVSVAALAAARVVTPWSLAAFAALPLGVANVRAVLRSREGWPEDLARLDARSAQHQMLFGLLFAGALAAKALTA